MTVFLDTNVILDFFMKRQPFYADSVRLFSLSVNKSIKAFTSTSSITDIFYLLNRHYKDAAKARASIIDLIPP
jgi:predicted nucleic acid-binding protein